MGRARPEPREVLTSGEGTFTRKGDFREHYPTRLFSSPLPEVVRIHASTGTTGRPTIGAGGMIDASAAPVAALA